MRFGSSVSSIERARRLASLEVGERGVVRRVLRDNPARAERLSALGVTPGARIRLLQRAPGFVFECDESELAVEPSVAHSILVEDGS
jgi:Fe2+ transport system protein FeoA